MPHTDCGAPLGIGDAARHLGVSVEALRYYESEGLVAPQRSASGRRIYDQRTLDALHVIVTMRAVGFAIADVRRLIEQKADAPKGVLVQRARATLLTFRDDLAARRAALDQADALMDRWLADLNSTGW